MQIIEDFYLLSFYNYNIYNIKGTILGFSVGLCLRSYRLAWLVDGGGLLALELGARFEFLEQLWVLAHLAACTEHVAPFQLELQSRPGRHARLSSLQQQLRGNSWAYLLLLRVSLSVLGSRWRVDSLHWTQAAHATRHWLHHRQCFASFSRWEACGVSRDPSCS